MKECCIDTFPSKATRAAIEALRAKVAAGEITFEQAKTVLDRILETPSPAEGKRYFVVNAPSENGGRVLGPVGFPPYELKVGQIADARALYERPEDE